jgi:sporulation protein YlmC with PRC-barrel domain
MNKSLLTLLIVASFLLFSIGSAFADRGDLFDRPQRLNELMGNDVINRQGEELGNLEDLITGSDGNIEYMVVAMGGIIGLGARLVAIPIEAASPTLTDENRISIDVQTAQLDGAPTFSRDNYPDFTDKQWQQESRGYFQNGGAASPRQDRQTN